MNEISSRKNKIKETKEWNLYINNTSYLLKSTNWVKLPMIKVDKNARRFIQREHWTTIKLSGKKKKKKNKKSYESTTITGRSEQQ